MIKFLDLKAQQQRIREELDDAISRVVSSCQFVLGDEGLKFEHAFANYLGVKHCVGVGNGTDAIVLALRALNIRPGDEVIVPNFTFFATAEAVMLVGAIPVVCDCKNNSPEIDMLEAAKLVTEKTRAIICVHLYGIPCDMDEIQAFSRHRNLLLIEDCAQAHGAEWKGQKVGTFGIVSTFSFYPGKNLGAYGDAGAVVTNDDNIDAILRNLRNHGSSNKYTHHEIGYNSRLDEIQAAVLNVKLSYLTEWNAERCARARIYYEGLEDVEGVRLFEISEFALPVWHIFPILVQDRAKLRANLLINHKVETGFHYPSTIESQPAYHSYMSLAGKSDFRNIDSDISYSMLAAATELSLPMYPELRVEDVVVVTEGIKEGL